LYLGAAWSTSDPAHTPRYSTRANMGVIATVIKKVERPQCVLDGSGCGHWGLGVAGALMFLVFCPMSIVAVAAPYWTASEGSSSVSASLWTVSITVGSVDADMDKCGDEMRGFNESGKVHAIRSFTITALLLSLASATALLIAFLPVRKSTPALGSNTILAGAGFAAATFLLNFLSVRIVKHVGGPSGEYRANGLGFIFLILEFFLISLAIVLAILALRQALPTKVIIIHEVVQLQQQTTPQWRCRSTTMPSSASLPTLITSSSESVVPNPKV